MVRELQRIYNITPWSFALFLLLLCDREQQCFRSSINIVVCLIYSFPLFGPWAMCVCGGVYRVVIKKSKFMYQDWGVEQVPLCLHCMLSDLEVTSQCAKWIQMVYWCSNLTTWWLTVQNVQKLGAPRLSICTMCYSLITHISRYQGKKSFYVT